MPGDIKWSDHARRIGVFAVANALGCAAIESRPALGRCPACRTERRSIKDARPPVTVDVPKAVWHCKSCHAGGGVLDVAAYALVGAPFQHLTGVGKDRVHEWFGGRFGLPGPSGTGTDAGAECASIPWRRPDPNAREAVPPRPPVKEVESLWHDCVRPRIEPEVACFLSSRALDPIAIEDFGLARALPGPGDLP